MPPAKGLPSEKKIMVFDDDDAILQMLKFSLEAEGFQVRTGRDGSNILKKAVDYRPDLIISDLMMPGGGGYEVIRLLQSDEITRKTPIVMVTGFSMDPSTKKMIQQEPNLAGFFEKPLRAERLLKKVHEILNTKSLQEQVNEQQSKNPDLDDPMSQRFF
jgi:two-component system alkaline phosphatase synthesis response regulator PhoP